MKVRVCVDVDLPEATVNLLKLAGISLDEVVTKAVNKVISQAIATPPPPKEVEAPPKAGEVGRKELPPEYLRDGRVDWERIFREMAKGVRHDFLSPSTLSAARRIIDLLKKRGRGVELLGKTESGSRKYLIIKEGIKYYLFTLGIHKPYIVYFAVEGRESFLKKIHNSRALPRKVYEYVRNVTVPVLSPPKEVNIQKIKEEREALRDAYG